jgi:hypothetical protein
VSHPHEAAEHDGGQGTGYEGRWDDDQPATAPEPPPVTGDPVVDEAVAQLASVTALLTEDQPAAYDAVHRVLQDRLADVEG